MDLSQPATPNDDLTGQQLDGYRVLRRLGSGGMAVVYLAEQRSLDRQVALKVLHASLASDAAYVARFQNEARAAASLVHPSIVQIYEVGHADGVHFIAQEYVAGKNLAEVLERQGALDPGVVLDILRQVVSALCKAHELGIVHRDIKPENILFSHSGEVKVADFGLARLLNTDTKTLTQVGVAMGTPLYMSPEQVEGRPVDVRSDIYSLGVTCYHLLAGNPPHRGETALAIAVQHLNTPATPLENVRQDLPGALARLVHRMLSKKPEGRPANPSALLAELRELAKKAAEEGWAEGPDNWSLADWLAADTTHTRSSEALSQLMQTEAKFQLGRRRWGALAGGLLIAALLGVFLGAVTRPRFFLAGTPFRQVPERDSAAAQLFFANMDNSEAAWLKAADYPDADPFQVQLAKQGLVRFHLLVDQDYRKAKHVLHPLEQLSKENDSMQPLQAFVYACLCISHERLDEREQAQDVGTQMTLERRKLLRRNEPQIYELLQSSLRRLRD